jgi:hypothetical protein
MREQNPWLVATWVFLVPVVLGALWMLVLMAVRGSTAALVVLLLLLVAGFAK